MIKRIPNHKPIPASMFALLAGRNAEVSGRVSTEMQSTPPKQLFLPGTNNLIRVMPNHLARSSLFAPIARGTNVIYNGTQLESRKDAIIHCWGPQLDEGMADVWMHAMHLAAKHPLGDLVVIQRAKFLREIGRHTGKCEYDWLHHCMQT
jgi:hypothetical protein